MGSMAGKSVLVTGGGSGIGLACAARLVSDGAAVTICGRSEERLKGAADELATAGDGKVTWIATDITSEDDVQAAVAHAVEHGGGRLDGVAASAGGSVASGALIFQDLEPFRATVELNLVGTFLTIKHAAVAIGESGGGSIVAVSSHAGLDSFRFLGAYGASKAGMDHLVRVAADELAPGRIRVNSVLPGIVDTEVISSITSGGPVYDSYMEEIPLRRVGRPEEIAALICFLLGPESEWITGQAISIDGGQSVRKGADYGYFNQMMYGEDPRWRFVGGA